MGRIYDSEAVKNKVSQELADLKRLTTDPELLKAIEEVKNNINSEIDTNVKFVVTDYLTRQRFLYFLGGYLVVHDERKAWYFYHAVMLCLAIEEVEELVRQKFGKDYPRVRQNILRYGALLSKVKYHLDYMDDKKLKDGDTQSPVYQRTLDLISQMPIVFQELDYIFLIISNYTNLGNVTVPNQAIQVFQQQYKKVSYEEQRRQRPDMPQPEGAGGG